MNINLSGTPKIVFVRLKPYVTQFRNNLKQKVVNFGFIFQFTASFKVVLHLETICVSDNLDTQEDTQTFGSVPLVLINIV